MLGQHRLIVLSFIAATTWLCGAASSSAHSASEATYVGYAGEMGVGVVLALEDPTRPEEPLQADARQRYAGAYQMLSVCGGQSYVMQNRARGAFGSYALALDITGRPWGVKSIYMSDRYDLGDLRREFGLFAALARGVEVREMVRTKARHQGFDAAPSVDVVHVVHVVMTAMHGDVQGLLDTMSWYPPFLRQVIWQISADARALHQMGFVHNDIRPPNMLWDADGRIVLSDYGLATRVNQDGYALSGSFDLRRAKGVGQPNCPFISAPEMYLGRYDAKADVWALGLAVAGMMGDNKPLARSEVFALGTKSVQYARWRESLRDADGRINLDHIPEPHQFAQNVPHAGFNELFHTIRAVDPGLCHLLVAHMLVVDPQERYSMQEVHDAVESMMRPDDFVRVKEAFGVVRALELMDGSEDALFDVWQHARQAGARTSDAPSTPHLDSPCLVKKHGSRRPHIVRHVGKPPKTSV